MGYARRMRLPLSVLVLALSTACSGPSAPPAPTKASEPAATDATKVASAPEAAKAAKAEPGDGFAKPAASGVVSLGDISLEVPGSWIKVPPQSGMRLAQYDIPGKGGAGSMAVFRFRGGGSASANLARWKGQLQPGPDATAGGGGRDGGRAHGDQPRRGRAIRARPHAGRACCRADRAGQDAGCGDRGAGDPYFIKSPVRPRPWTRRSPPGRRCWRPPGLAPRERTPRPFQGPAEARESTHALPGVARVRPVAASSRPGGLRSRPRRLPSRSGCEHPEGTPRAHCSHRRRASGPLFQHSQRRRVRTPRSRWSREPQGCHVGLGSGVLRRDPRQL